MMALSLYLLAGSLLNHTIIRPIEWTATLQSSVNISRHPIFVNIVHKMSES